MKKIKDIPVYPEDEIVFQGDIITLYVVELDDIIEFKVGDAEFVDLGNICLNMRVKESFSYCGNTYIIQYIEKNQWRGTALTDIKRKEAYVDISDFIVRINTFRCSEHHELTLVNAIVTIFENGELKRYKYPGMYCETCDKYFIYEQTYQYIKKRGYICCRVIKRSELSMYNSGDFSTWKPKSILRLYGYSVEKSKDLTDNERQSILAFLIENDILTISKIVSYLESFIILRRRNEKMQTAISKWRSDIHYVLNYQKKNVNIRVNRIITKNY